MILIDRIRLPRTLLAVLISLLPLLVSGAPGDVLFTDNFNRNNLAPWTTTNNARSGILTGGQTSNSGNQAGFTRNQAVTVTSPAFNAAVPAAQLTFWLRRGSDALPNSEDTDANEDFVVEYQTAGGAWNQVVTYQGSGTNGQIYNASFNLPSAALHGALRLRVQQTFGSGFNFDYYHFDDFVVTEISVPDALDVGLCDDFETGLGANWTVNATSGAASVTSATSLSPSNSLSLNGGVVEVVSRVIDTSNITFSDITLWVRRGSDAFSEDPDGGENLIVEYRNNSGTWVSLETFNGSGGAGQQFNRTYTIPASGRHANFQFRFRMTAGSGLVWDFWHADDVCFNQDPNPILQLEKLLSTLSDPINGTSAPKGIPGAIVQYTVSVTNQGIGSVDANTLEILDPLPANTALFVSTSGGDPVTFINGATSSGLNFNYPANVEFSNTVGGGAPFSYLPTPDVDGFDANVTGLRITPNGSMNPSVGAGEPSFSIEFRLRIE